MTMVGEALGVGEAGGLFAVGVAPDGCAGLRERAYAFGCEALTEGETLALLLARANVGTGVAGELMQRFGSLSAVLGASVQALAAIVGQQVAVDLKVIQSAAERMLVEPLRKREVIASWSQLLAYVRTALQHEEREQVRVLFLDKKNQLIADVITGRGTVDHAPVYPREIVRRALELNASAIILVHNHPSGDPKPSGADVEMTRQVVEACRTLSIAVHDHLVVGRDGVASLKGLGLM